MQPSGPAATSYCHSSGYEQIWKYDLETLAKDLGAHLVFGSATAGAFALLSRHRKTTGKKTRKERE